MADNLYHRLVSDKFIIADESMDDDSDIDYSVKLELPYIHGVKFKNFRSRVMIREFIRDGFASETKYRSLISELLGTTKWEETPSVDDGRSIWLVYDKQ
jgi:hypothetical protein